MPITISGSGITSSEILDGTITNADINASAAIAGSKLSGAGKVLQVVQNALNPSAFTTATTSWTVIIDMDVTITPSNASSKVLVTFNCGGGITGSTTNQDKIHIRIKRGATVIRQLDRYGFNRNDDYSSLPIYLTYLDSPNTTSATTYTLEMLTDSGSVQINRDANIAGGVTIAQEVAG